MWKSPSLRYSLRFAAHAKEASIRSADRYLRISLLTTVAPARFREKVQGQSPSGARMFGVRQRFPNHAQQSLHGKRLRQQREALERDKPLHQIGIVEARNEEDLKIRLPGVKA